MTQRSEHGTPSRLWTAATGLRTPISKGLEIIKGLRGHTTGYAVPTFVVDAPGGGGKIPLLPEYAIGWDKGDLMMRNYEGSLFRYPDNHAESKDIH